jgi:hypothetical protein
LRYVGKKKSFGKKKKKKKKKITKDKPEVNWQLTASSSLGYPESDQNWVWFSQLEPEFIFLKNQTKN